MFKDPVVKGPGASDFRNMSKYKAWTSKAIVIMMMMMIGVVVVAARVKLLRELSSFNRAQDSDVRCVMYDVSFFADLREDSATFLEKTHRTSKF